MVCPHIITATSGANGTISPSGEVLVQNGANQTFTFTPANSCYEIDQVLVNNANNPAAVAAGNYTFTNVTANQTISVTFKIKTYSITATAGANGTISPSGSVPVSCGANQTFTFTPANSCYEINQVLVNNVNNPAAVAAGSYTFTSITANQTISVTFKIKTYSITATAGANGTISPSGNVTVNCGANQTFTFTPANNCYEIDQVLVDNVNNPAAVAAGSHTFTNVTANHTISVSFKIKTYNITATAGANGTISPSGSVPVSCGTNQTFTFTPANSCYEIDQVLVDNVNNPAAVAAGSHTFTNVTANHTISVSFKIKTYNITATAGANGSITPSGNITVNCGTSQTFSFIPAGGYEVDVVTVNGIVVTISNNQYTFNNVTENATIHAIFKELPPNYFTINAIPNNTNWGAVTGSGSYEAGNTATLVAIPAQNCRFVNWRETGTEVCTDSIYTFIVSKDRSLVAHFEEVVGIADFDFSDLKVYPNPTTGALKILSGKLCILSVQIFDVYGRNAGINIPVCHENSESETVINISHLPVGAYLLKINTEVGQVIKKVLKE